MGQVISIYPYVPKYDLLLIDFVWLPELAYQGLIEPLDLYRSDVEKEIETTVEESLSDENDKVKKGWVAVIRHLASEGKRYYAFPMMLNFQGRLSKASDEKSLHSYEDWENKLHKSYAIQTAHSACPVYELYAHFGVRAAQPICFKDPSEYGLKLDIESDETKSAIADYLARLFLSAVLKRGDKGLRDRRFKIDHKEEVQLLNMEEFSGDICFNLELYGRLNKGSDWELHPPLKRIIRDTNGVGETHFLTSLGGYGIVVSRQAVDKEDAVNLALSLFKQENALRVKDLAKYLNLSAVRSIETFLAYHCRPRIPFWSHAEELISKAIEELDFLVRTKMKPSETPETLKTVTDEVKKLITSDSDAKRVIENLESRLRLSFSNNGWRVE